MGFRALLRRRKHTNPAVSGETASYAASDESETGRDNPVSSADSLAESGEKSTNLSHESSVSATNDSASSPNTMVDDISNILGIESHVYSNSYAEGVVEPQPSFHGHNQQVSRPHYYQHLNEGRGLMGFAKECFPEYGKTRVSLISPTEEEDMDSSSVFLPNTSEGDIGRPRSFWLPPPVKNPMLSPAVRDYLRTQRCVGSLGAPTFLGQKTANPFKFGQEYAECLPNPLIAHPQ